MKSPFIKLAIILFLIQLTSCTFPSNMNDESSESYSKAPIGQQEFVEIFEPVKITQREGLQNKFFEWSYNRKKYKVTVPLYQSIANNYASISRELTYYGTLPNDVDTRIYTRILDLNDTEGFGELIEFFNATKNNQKLSDEDLAELIISFVQTIPYDYKGLENPNQELRTPYETLFDQTGVCSDKTLVAAKILHHFGFGTALFLFDDEKHMSLGLQCPKSTSSYLSGYCYVETTAAEAPGVAPELLAGDLTLKSQPKVIPLGTGKQYTRALENIRKEVKRREFCQQLPEIEESLIEREKIVKQREAKIINPIDYAEYRDAYTVYSRTYQEYMRINAGCRGIDYTPQNFY